MCHLVEPTPAEADFNLPQPVPRMKLLELLCCVMNTVLGHLRLQEVEEEAS